MAATQISAPAAIATPYGIFPADSGMEERLGISFIAMPCAFAGHSHEEMFKSMDADSDGKLTRTEHTAGSTKMFADMDTNKDGQVAAAEMTAAHAKMKADKGAVADASEMTKPLKPQSCFRTVLSR